MGHPRMVRVASLALYERPLVAPPPPAPVELPAGVELVVVDAPGATGQVAAGWPRDGEQRLRAGEVCGIVRAGGGVVAYCWLTTGAAWVEEIGRLVVPGHREAYLYDAHTSPGWRGRGLFTALLTGLLAFAGERGLERAMIFVLTGNRPSVKAIERAGFERFQVVTSIEGLGFRYLWHRGGRAARGRVTLEAR